MDFDDALLAAGIDPGGIDVRQLETWQRVPTTDKPRKRNGSVLMLNSNPPEAIVKNWATGFTAVGSGTGWFVNKKRFLMYTARRRAVGAEHDAVAEKTRIELQMLKPASRNHPYLERKKISPHGALQKFNDLIIPMQDIDGKFWSYQKILSDGEKRFQRGGRTYGCYHMIEGKREEKLLIAEGFATGATLVEDCGYSVAVAFSAQNLPVVACALRDIFPDVEIVIAADNDNCVEGNPGMTYAIEAATKCDGIVVYPDFGLLSVARGFTDWNDMHEAFGAKLVRDQVENLITVFT